MIVLEVFTQPNRTDSAMNGLAILIQARLDDLGMSRNELAEAADISSSTLSDIMNSPKPEPRLSTLEALADPLGVTLRQLIEACGYSVTNSPSPADEQARIQTIVAAVPDLRLFLENLAELTADDRAAILSMTEAMVQKRRRSK
jgi:transcriptional regulator with XRE-family HTH domain